MFDAAAPSLSSQRSFGAARVVLGAGGKVSDLAQKGSAKAMLPRVFAPSQPEIVFLNTSGGLTGGDDLAYEVALAPGLRAVATTQCAERAYDAGGAGAKARFHAEVGAGGRLDYLPQETILFSHSNLSRHSTVDLARGASCLWAEIIVLGRAAMGEGLQGAHLRDARLIRREGRAFWAETLHLTPDVLQGQSAALLGDARAFATVVFAADGAEDAAAPLRGLMQGHMHGAGCRASVSGWDGRCIIRLAARDLWPLRCQMQPLIARLMGGAPLPRLMQTLVPQSGVSA